MIVKTEYYELTCDLCHRLEKRVKISDFVRRQLPDPSSDSSAEVCYNCFTSYVDWFNGRVNGRQADNQDDTVPF